MAHFAELDENNVVINVVVINDNDCLDGDENESEVVGIAFCHSLWGDDKTWKQTSYNSNIRKHYAGIGFTYDASKDAFIAPQPFASWILDSDYNWITPVALPSDVKTNAGGEGKLYIWNEANYQSDNTNGWEEVTA